MGSRTDLRIPARGEVARSPRQPTAVWLVCAVALLATGGCRPAGPERVIVSGTVTYRGEPLEAGVIWFFPTEGTDAPMAGAHVVDGKYCIDQKGGVPVGTHKVMIEAYRPNGTARSQAELPPGDIGAGLVPKQQYLPAKYNVNTELKATLEPGDPSTTIDFELSD